jgi:hypothetical protein
MATTSTVSESTNNPEQSMATPIEYPTGDGEPPVETDVHRDTTHPTSAEPGAETESMRTQIEKARRLVSMELDLADMRRQLAENNLAITEAQLELAERQIEQLKVENERLREENEELRAARASAERLIPRSAPRHP